MSQMSPIFWLVLLMYFILTLTILIMMIYFLFLSFPSVSMNLMNNKELMYWMW